jgi:hypothetical protein
MAVHCFHWLTEKHSAANIDTTTLRLARSATSWGSAIYRASHDDYGKSVLPSSLDEGLALQA